MKHIKQYIRFVARCLLVMLTAFSLTGCHDNEPDAPGESESPQSVTLIYAVAANNLSYYLTLDKQEMMAAAGDIDLYNNVVLVYSVNASNKCKLEKLKFGADGSGYFDLVKEYPETPLSTDPERINEVLAEVAKMYPEASKGLVLWSHATAWKPWFPPLQPRNAKRRSFGQDVYDGIRYECNINDLAEAIPENTFKYIWFDCCYMGNIETLYQLRNKTEYLIGYPTEMHNEGMPYDLTLPYLAKGTPDLSGAAQVLFDYYNKQYITVSVAVVKAMALNAVAEAAKPIYQNCGRPQNLYAVNNYSRLNGFPLYDLKQVLTSYVDVDRDMIDNLDQALDSAIVTSYVSDRSWSNVFFNHENECGLSVSDFINNDTTEDLFYMSLDWYTATR